MILWLKMGKGTVYHMMVMKGTIMAEPSGFGVVIPEDVQSAIKLCVPSGCKKGVFYINKSNSQIAKQYEE